MRNSRSNVLFASAIPAKLDGDATLPAKFGKGKHLFEKLHGKDPYRQIEYMEKLSMGSGNYSLTEVK